MSATSGMIHTVYFWLKPEVDAAGHVAFAAGARDLANAPTVLQFYGGGPAETTHRDVTDHSFDYCIHLFFADEA
ncbi:MAG: Dabb family protein, partial [Bacteroidota bacterium]